MGDGTKGMESCGQLSDGTSTTTAKAISILTRCFTILIHSALMEYWRQWIAKRKIHD
jgi:hypothetical protein